MKKCVSFAVYVLLLAALAGCETVNGITKDTANTARNIRDIFGAGKDIGDMTR